MYLYYVVIMSVVYLAIKLNKRIHTPPHRDVSGGSATSIPWPRIGNHMTVVG